MSNTAKTLDTHRTIKTSRFGEIAIDETKVIIMTSPFLGFPNDKEFFLLPHAPQSPFWWLQATNNPELAFVVIQPSLLDISYNPKISNSIQEELNIHDEQDQEILVILTIPTGHPEQMTANLLGPVVINTSKRLAKQVLLDPTRYTPCWPIGGEE